jgi:hypothetical protein
MAFAVVGIALICLATWVGIAIATFIQDTYTFGFEIRRRVPKTSYVAPPPARPFRPDYTGR